MAGEVVAIEKEVVVKAAGVPTAPAPRSSRAQRAGGARWQVRVVVCACAVYGRERMAGGTRVKVKRYVFEGSAKCRVLCASAMSRRQVRRKVAAECGVG